MKKHIGYFSIGADGDDYCFHEGVDQDPMYIAKVLTESVTGGPYTVKRAYIEMEDDESTNYLPRQ